MLSVKKSILVKRVNSHHPARVISEGDCLTTRIYLRAKRIESSQQAQCRFLRWSGPAWLRQIPD